MNLPEKITYIHDTSENVDEILANKINQLIDYLKEREECKNCKTDTLQIIIADKNNDCVACGRPISKITSPKKIDEELGAGCSGNMMPIDVEGLLEEYVGIRIKRITNSNRVRNKVRMQQIINQIKDAIHENN